MVALLAMLVGCAPQPASIKFEGEPVVTVHGMDAVQVNKATVLDADGKAIEPQPALTWAVTPDAVAKLEGTKVTPVANGEASVEAKVGEVKSSYKFVVALPDKVEVAGYTAGTPVPVGGNVTLTAKVLAGATEVPGQTVTWAVDDATKATVDANGLLLGVAEGPAKVTATAGALSATVDITVGAAVAAVAPQ